MARVIRSPRAKRDIVEVIEYKDALAVIATDPQRGKSRSVAPDILALHIRQPGRPARHVLFYRIGATGTVEVVRFLYDAMDFDRYQPDASDAGWTEGQPGLSYGPPMP